jgi:hypothetical protein
MLARPAGVLDVVVTCNRGNATPTEVASSGLIPTALRMEISAKSTPELYHRHMGPQVATRHRVWHGGGRWLEWQC